MNKLPVFQNSGSNRSAQQRRRQQQRRLPQSAQFRPATHPGPAGWHARSGLEPERQRRCQHPAAELMSRVDVVTGGASAVYGSDAITGVVNFILDKNFDGVKYEANSRHFEICRWLLLQGQCGSGHGPVRRQGPYRRRRRIYESWDGVLKAARPIGAAGLAVLQYRQHRGRPGTNILHGRPDGLNVQRQDHLHQLLGQRL